MKKYFVLFSFIIIIFFSSCDRRKSGMPHGMKELHVESSSEIGTLQFEGSVETAEISKDIRDTAGYARFNTAWDNSANKPFLLACIGGKSRLLSSDKYSYENRNGRGILNISYFAEYIEEDSPVKFYLFDKKIKYKDGILSYPDKSEIYPAGSENADFIYLSETTISEIKSKKSNLSFRPLGTLVLLDGVIPENKEDINVTFESDCMSLSGDIDVSTGFAKSAVKSKTLVLHRGSASSWYAIYAFLRDTTEGTLKLKGNAGHESEKTFSLQNITKYGVSIVNQVSEKRPDIAIDLPSGKADTSAGDGSEKNTDKGQNTDGSANPPANITPSPELHTVRFHSNDGTGTIKEYFLKKGEMMYCPNVTALFQIPYNRTTPDGWNQDAESGVVQYSAGSSIIMGDSDINLYAIWYISDLSKEKQVGSTVFRNVEKFVEGVTPPSEDEWEQVWRRPRTATREGKTVPWKEGKGYYDTNQGYDSLCWAATNANILHWWMDRNKENIKKYGRYTGPSHYDGLSKDSDIYRYFRMHWPNESNTTHQGFQWFLRGHSSNEKGGAFFSDVIKKSDVIYNILPNSGTGIKKGRFAKFCEEALLNGDAMGLAMHVHEYTIWGVDFDEDGFVRGLFATDSRDGNYISMKKNSVGMIYLNVTYVNNITKVYAPSYKKEVEIDEMQSFSQCKQYWNRYFSTTDK